MFRIIKMTSNECQAPHFIGYSTECSRALPCWTCAGNHYQEPVMSHDDVIKWKHFPRYWPFARGIHRSPVNSSHKGQWRGALMFTLICARIKGWVNIREAGKRYRGHYDVTVMERLSMPWRHLVTWYEDLTTRNKYKMHGLAIELYRILWDTSTCLRCMFLTYKYHIWCHR